MASRTCLLGVLLASTLVHGQTYPSPSQGVHFIADPSSYHPLEPQPPNYITAHHFSPMTYFPTNVAPVQRLHGSYIPVAVHTQYPASVTAQPLISHYVGTPSYSASKEDFRVVNGHVLPSSHTYEPSIQFVSSSPPPQTHPNVHLPCRNPPPSNYLLHLSHMPTNSTNKVTSSYSQPSSTNHPAGTSSTFQLPDILSIFGQIHHPELKASIQQPKMYGAVSSPGYFMNHESPSGNANFGLSGLNSFSVM